MTSETAQETTHVATLETAQLTTPMTTQATASETAQLTTPMTTQATASETTHVTTSETAQLTTHATTPVTVAAQVTTHATTQVTTHATTQVATSETVGGTEKRAASGRARSRCPAIVGKKTDWPAQTYLTPFRGCRVVLSCVAVVCWCCFRVFSGLRPSQKRRQEDVTRTAKT